MNLTTKVQLQQQLDDERQRSRTLLADTRKAESAKEILQKEYDDLSWKYNVVKLERDSQEADAKRAREMVLNREAYIGRLCIDKGVIR